MQPERDTTPAQSARSRENRAERIYQALKQDIFEFRLLPGDKFSENELAQRMNVSRTPVREALYRLHTEGYLDVLFRSGWQVKPLDFRRFEELYDLRIVLEQHAVDRLCRLRGESATLAGLRNLWLGPPAQQGSESTLCALDEHFHRSLVIAAGNREMLRVHDDITERLRIIRRLDFTDDQRIEATWREHAHVLNAIDDGDSATATQTLKAHIEASKASVHRITLERMQQARDRS